MLPGLKKWPWPCYDYYCTHCNHRVRQNNIFLLEYGSSDRNSHLNKLMRTATCFALDLGLSFFRFDPSTHSSGFSSFRMASHFLECLGLAKFGVDVVSDAENIKKLLRMPYSKNAVSMVRLK